MTADDLQLLRMANLCTFPGDFKKDLIKLNIDPQLADDMCFAFFSYRNVRNEYDFPGFIMDYCIGNNSWTEAILIYINSFANLDIY
ncbi:hypothetical protein M0R04_04705 [Candidatus Dojkabacteria bacterium]|jgi:hypothetical protein|nr:hypothetical protein [Candidatus Dojkabacteria bacterium]